MTDVTTRIQFLNCNKNLLKNEIVIWLVSDRFDKVMSQSLVKDNDVDYAESTFSACIRYDHVMVSS